MSQAQVTITRRGTERVRGGHLWVYRSDVREAAVLGDRIVVLSHRPGMVSQILENHAPRPRTLKDPAVEEVIRRSNEILKAEVQWSNNQTKLLL